MYKLGEVHTVKERGQLAYQKLRTIEALLKGLEPDSEAEDVVAEMKDMLSTAVSQVFHIMSSSEAANVPIREE